MTDGRCMAHGWCQGGILRSRCLIRRRGRLRFKLIWIVLGSNAIVSVVIGCSAATWHMIIIVSHIVTYEISSAIIVVIAIALASLEILVVIHDIKLIRIVLRSNAIVSVFVRCPVATRHMIIIVSHMVTHEISRTIIVVVAIALASL